MIKTREELIKVLLLTVYALHKPRTIKEISEITGLGRNQIRRWLRALNNHQTVLKIGSQRPFKYVLLNGAIPDPTFCKHGITWKNCDVCKKFN